MVKPIVKYQGGKSREIKTITGLLPSFTGKIIEPFCGGAAVAFHYRRQSILSDVNRDIINLYQVVASDRYDELQLKVDYIKTLEHDDLETEFYASREAINQPWDCVDPLQRALSYIIVRQLCFSGMERYNANGEFNVPFGHYKSFSCNLSKDHHDFLLKCKISHSSFEHCFEDANENDFIFIDPPYLDRLGYTTGDGGSSLHEKLLSCLKATPAKWLIIHSDHEFYRDSYEDYNIMTKDFVYSQRFGKNKNHSGAKVQHLYITNYPVQQLAHPTVTQHLAAV
jgi:DNA adenine methylase